MDSTQNVTFYATVAREKNEFWVMFPSASVSLNGLESEINTSTAAPKNFTAAPTSTKNFTVTTRVSYNT